MGIFNKNVKNGRGDSPNIRLFNEIIRETSDVYEELKNEYGLVDSLADEFDSLLEKILPEVDGNCAQSLKDLSAKMRKLDTTAKNSVRDIRDILRYQRKMLKEIS